MTKRTQQIEMVETVQIGPSQEFTGNRLTQTEKTKRGILFYIGVQAVINIGLFWATCYLLGRVDGIAESSSESIRSEQQQSDTDPASFYHLCQQCKNEWFGPPPPPNGFVHCPVCSTVRCYRTFASTSTSGERTNVLHLSSSSDRRN